MLHYTIAIAFIYKKIFYVFVSDHSSLLKYYTQSIFRRSEETLKELFHSLNFLSTSLKVYKFEV